jgi:small subunit ribosomal protein S9
MVEKKAKVAKDKPTIKAKKDPKESIKPVKDMLTSETIVVETPDEDKNFLNSLNANETVEFTGKYIKAIGRRKRATAQVRLYENGKGVIMINGKRVSEYFPGDGLNLITQPLKVTGHGRDFNFSIITQGGGKQGQIGAVRLGISRALLAYDVAAKEALKVNGFLTRDPRRVERKKPGLKKARKAPQWSKR